MSPEAVQDLLLHHSSELPVHHAHQLPQNAAAAWHMALPMVQQLEAKTKLRDNCGDELYSSVYLLLPVLQLVLFSLECFFVDVLHCLSLSPKLLLMYGKGEADEVLSFSDFILKTNLATWNWLLHGRSCTQLNFPSSHSCGNLSPKLI
jgi:hypothetical protein